MVEKTIGGIFHEYLRLRQGENLERAGWNGMKIKRTILRLSWPQFKNNNAELILANFIIKNPECIKIMTRPQGLKDTNKLQKRPTNSTIPLAPERLERPGRSYFKIPLQKSPNILLHIAQLKDFLL